MPCLRGTMTEEQNDERAIPLMQRVLDNPFILLFIGVAVPTLTYIVWGIMELISIPVTN
jgi:hypothetical protein